MRTFGYTSQFKKDLKRCEKRGRDLAKVKSVMQAIVEEGTLPDRLRDHPLRGNWHGTRECHLEPDWLLIYTASSEHVTFIRTGTHSDLF